MMGKNCEKYYFRGSMRKTDESRTRYKQITKIKNMAE